MGNSELKNKTTKSLFWSFLDKFGEQALNFISMFVLMNIVSTDDYGIIGSLAVLSAVLPLLVDSGFGRALLNRKNPSEEAYNSMFYFNVAMSIVIYVALFALMPSISSLFKAKNEMVIPVARVMFLGIFINAFGLIHKTLLTKKADFKSLTQLNLIALTATNIIAIWMAIKGYGVWALVAQILLLAVFRTVLLWMYSSWRPALMFRIGVLRELFGFSNKLVLASFIGTITNNIYPSIIAVFYPMSQVAFYDRAKRYEDIPFLVLTNTYRSVSMLILSEINDQRERLHRVVSKMMKSIAFVSFPVAALMVVVAEPVFYLFFKEKWMASVPYFQILTFAGMFIPFLSIINELFISTEKSKYFLGVEIAKSILLVGLVIAFFPKGIVGLAVSWVVYTVISLAISLILSRKLITYSLIDFGKDIFPYVCVAFISGVAAFFAGKLFHHHLLIVVVSSVTVGICYLGICLLLRLEMTQEVSQWITSQKNRRL